MTELLTRNRSEETEAEEPLSPHWVDQDAQARKVARSKDGKAVWIVNDTCLARRIVANSPWRGRKVGYLVLTGGVCPELLPALQRQFVRVAYGTRDDAFLPPEELMAALKSPGRKDRFIGGMVDEQAQVVTLWRGDLTPLVVPFGTFAPTANGLAPDWGRFTVTDYGHTLRFGTYEAAADAVLFEHDPDFRRRLNRNRIANQKTLGASIRRLRMQRQLTRNDFPGLDPKTLARIERGEVAKPHAGTVRLISQRLGVAVDELRSF
jgi:hypothetical protein